MEVNELEPTPVNERLVPEGTPDKQSVREAAKILAGLRHKKEEEPRITPYSTRAEALSARFEAPPPEPEFSAEENSAPPIEEPSAEPEAPEPEPYEEPPLEAPRSWTSEDKDTFATLPRATQERLIALDRDRELAVRKVQNETAEQRKQYEERMRQAEEIRKQYEQALPTIAETLQAAQMSEYADIKTPADERKVAAEDPVRYMQYLARQREVQLAQQELAYAKQRQEQERNQQWSQFAQREDELFAEKHPEFKGEKRTEASQKVYNTLKSVGLTDDEIRQVYTQERWARDHRVQELFWKAARYDAAQQQAKVAPKKNLPPVTQRPGAAPAHNASKMQQVNNLKTRLDQTGNVRDAARFLAEVRRTQRT